MAYVILDTCSQCGECLDECPIEAIEPADPIYVINETCCEFQECVAVCPEEAIVHEDEVPAGRTPGADSTSGIPNAGTPSKP